MKIRKTIAFGALIGTTFALLFAPQKGQHIRSRMRQASEKGEDNLIPLKKGYKDFFAEVFRVAKMQLPVAGNKNPFTITSLKKQ